jgi:hypothetical protein
VTIDTIFNRVVHEAGELDDDFYFKTKRENVLMQMLLLYAVVEREEKQEKQEKHQH